MSTSTEVIGCYTIPTWAFFEAAKIAGSKRGVYNIKHAAISDDHLVATNGEFLMTLRVTEIDGVIPEHIHSEPIHTAAIKALIATRRRAGRIKFTIHYDSKGDTHLSGVWDAGHGTQISFSAPLDRSPYINWRAALPLAVDPDQRHTELPCLPATYLTTSQMLWALCNDTKPERMHLRQLRTVTATGQATPYLLEPATLQPEIRRVLGLRTLCIPVPMNARKGSLAI